jgi:hypothetical protein
MGKKEKRHKQASLSTIRHDAKRRQLDHKNRGTLLN